MASIMVCAPKSLSSMKPAWSLNASTRGAVRRASAMRPATLTNAWLSSLSGGASMMMQLPAALLPDLSILK